MGIMKFLKGFTSPRAMCEQIIYTIEQTFEETKRLYPHREQHEYLALTWLSRMKAQSIIHFRNFDDNAMVSPAFTETYLFACVPSEKCARALGLYILYKERPQWVERYAEFASEFNRIMEPVFKAKDNGTLASLYNKYNPRLSEKYLTGEIID